MCLSATIRSPLRSKREMISPVRLRANASGFTRIRVRSKRRPFVWSGADCRLLLRGRGAPAARCRLADLGLAVRADLPTRVERLAARAARLLQPAQAAWAAEEALLDVEVAIGAREVVHVGEPRLRSGDLELALAPILEELRRPDDHVDDRADEREERRGRRAPHEHRVFDPPLRVRVGPVDEREVED